MSTDSTSVSDLVGLLLKEGQRRLLTVASIFAAVALLVLIIGLTKTKKYAALTVIVQESNSLIKPLTDEHAGGASNSPDQLVMTVQTLENKKILREILVFGGWVQPPPAKQPDPVQEERLLTSLKARIKVDSPAAGLIRIAYVDSDPERTYKIANKLAEIYIRETEAGNERESKEAFAFLDQQVKEYGDKLAEYHAQVLAHYQGTDDPTDPKPGPDPDPTPPGPDKPPTPPPVRPSGGGLSADELAALRAEESFLEEQIKSKPGEKSSIALRQKEDQLRQRQGQLQGDVDRLLSQYTEDHPDVRRVRRELKTVTADLSATEAQRKAAEKEEATTAALDDDVARVARERLVLVRKKIAQATGTRPRPTPGADPRPTPGGVPSPQEDPEMRGIGRDTTLSELLRRYEATRELYQDLLKRRERARVAMELDAQQRGTTIHIAEPAERPTVAMGLRLIHFSIIGLFLACIAPLGLLFALVRLDQRVRSPNQIEALARVPLLVSISFAPARRDRSRQRLRAALAALMVVGVFVAYAAAYFIKTRSS